MMVPVWAWWLFGGWNLLTFAIAVFDKVRAQRGGHRVRERTLLGLALMGGSPGLLLAMVVARHKVRKGRFLARLFLILLVQLIVVVAVAYASR